LKKQHKTGSLSDLDAAILGWLEGEWSPHTKAAYAANVREFVTATGKPFLSATIPDITAYQSKLKRGGYKPATVARKVAAVRSFYRYLNREEMTRLNLDSLDPVKITRHVSREKLLTEAEVKAILRAAEPDPVAHLFVRFLYLTACRKSEALALRWRDVTTLDEGAEVRVLGKGGIERSIYLTPELHDDLMAARGIAGDDDLLFPALKPLSAWRLVVKLAKAAKITKRVGPHSFRHAHLSHALMHGASIVEAKEQAGHASITTTSLYLHADGSRATAKRLKIK